MRRTCEYCVLKFTNAGKGLSSHESKTSDLKGFLGMSDVLNSIITFPTLENCNTQKAVKWLQITKFSKWQVFTFTELKNVDLFSYIIDQFALGFTCHFTFIRSKVFFYNAPSQRISSNCVLSHRETKHKTWPHEKSGVAAPVY